jgi:Flp pilus assembly protein TadD
MTLPRTLFRCGPIHIGIGLLATLLLGGCVLPDPYRQPERVPTNPANDPTTNQPGTSSMPDTPTPSVEPVPAPQPAPRPRTLGPAAKALVDQARAQSNAGNNTLAASTLERALRIEPDNPLVWIELAKVRQDDGNSAQAENLARKALTMATDGKTQAAAWKVIAESYRARGRNPEARDADAKAATLAQTAAR